MRTRHHILSVPLTVSIPIGMMLVAILAGLYSYTEKRSAAESVHTVATTIGIGTSTARAVPTTDQPGLEQVAAVIKSAPPSQPVASSSPTDSATLTVGSTRYTISVLPKETLATVMHDLATTNSSFTYTQQEYPGLGMFVESINGTASVNGYYWFLYVNGTESTTGISSAIVHPGDRIEWKYQQ